MQLAMAQEVLTNIDATGLSYLQRADDLARFGLAEARRSTSSLQPRMFQDSGLNEALRMLVERSNIDGRLECTFVSNLEHDESLPVALQQDLLRIAQEAISNAVRHARSTSICVTLRGDPPNLCLEIADNGSGLDTKKKTDQGFGLLNMRARVEKLKGSLKIQTAPGRGTRVIVTVPFTP
jgi:signal transduction histidine kinase